jgi:tetratricopeptide (TPR) repeat protein
MGHLAINFKLFSKLISFITIFSLLLQFCIAIPVIAATKKNEIAPPVIIKLESHLFFRTYDDDSIESRLTRIEKQVFGESGSQTIQERIARLQSVLEEQIRNSTLSPSSNPKTQSNQEMQDSNNNAPIINNSSNSERSRIAVQAAREAEMKKLLSEGVDLWRSKMTQEAQTKFEQVLRLDPTNSEAHYSLGIISESQNNLVQALASYETALQNTSNNREYKEAVDSLKKKLSKNEQISAKQAELRKLSELATQAFRRGEYVSALDLYKQLDIKAPNQALIKYNIGSIYLMMKDQNNALPYYKQAYKLSPKEPRYANAYNNLAQELQRAEIMQKEEFRQEEEGKRQQAYLSKQQNNQNTMWRANPNSLPANNFRTPNAVAGYGQSLPVQDAMAMLGFSGRGSNEGIIITKVITQSRAALAGLTPKDVIRAVDGFEVNKIDQVNSILNNKQLNQPIQMLIQRNGNLAVIRM